MKVTVIRGAAKNIDFGLNAILDIICGIMNELGVELYTADLFEDPIHHYKGIRSDVVHSIVENIKDSEGVILGTTSCLFAPSSSVQSFFEYLYHDYDDVLKGKNCMTVVVSLNGGERSAQEYLGKVLSHFGAYDSIRVCIDDKTAANMSAEDSEERGIIEKQAEDFYRVAAQKRKFFVPKVTEAIPVSSTIITEKVPTLETINSEALSDVFDPFDGFDDIEKEMLKAAAPKKSVSAPKHTGYKFDEFNEEQEEDIEKLTDFLSKILDEPDESVSPDFIKSPEPMRRTAKQPPKGSTCLSVTKGLPDRFNTDEASGINSVMQLNISGSESFTGYIHINNLECTFTEGIFDNPDITVMSDSAIWLDILRGKITAQKAFMIGQLKVRGNFILLNKFEKMFSSV